MHKLLARQLALASKKASRRTPAKANKGRGGKAAGRKRRSIDLDRLCELVSAAYARTDRDRTRTAQSLSKMLGELDQAHRRLRDAFDVIPEGVAVFDADDRYVLWNKQYEELYQSTGSVPYVGEKFEDALRGILTSRRLPEAEGREEQWLAERIARHRLPSSTTEQQLADGRWVRIEERRTSDGGSIGVRIDITDLKRREASFRLLLDANPVPMWVYDRNELTFLAVNEAAVRHYGYTRERFLAMTVLDIRPDDDRQRFREFRQNGDRSAGCSWRHRKADGSEIDVVIYSQLLTYEGREAAVVAAFDVTDRKRMESELRGTREFLNTILDNVPATIVVKDARTMKYRLINRAGEELYGIARENFVGRTAADIYPPDYAERVVEYDRDLLAKGEDCIDEHVLRTRDKVERIISSRRLVVRGADGEPEHLVTLTQDVSERVAARERLAYLAHHDALTDLPNRAAFNATMAAVLERAAAEDRPFGVVCLDIDHFKQTNDVFGHAVGDAVLQEAARRFREVAEGAFLARIGGDEFIIIVGGPVPQAIEALAERLQAAMTAPIEAKGHRLILGLSIGAAVFPTDGTDQAGLLNNADAALYRAKAEGRGTIRFFEADMDRQLRERRRLQHELRDALERDELSLWYQPQATIDATIVGFEALLRWNNRRRGYVPPDTFIPIAEESGLILPLSEWVLRQACREAALWPRPLSVAVNLSPVQFQHGDLPALVHTVLLETGLPASRLQLEITEGVLVDDCSRALSLLRKIKALGVRIAMDDFGTGYSSLSYLQAFPFDKIKIDKSFTANLHRDPQSAAIIRAVIGLGRSLDLPVTAEGVETQEQLAFLAQENCAEVQGYLIGRPAPVEEYGDVIGTGVTQHLAVPR